MPVLSKKEIIQKIKDKDLVFTPSLDTFQVRMHSVDLRLGCNFMMPKIWELTEKGRVALNVDYLDKNNKKSFDLISLKPGQYFEILPREFVVVETLEKIKMPMDVMAVLYPRSSVNRRGLSIDMSGIIDAGYEGHLIIPLKNNTSSQIIRIYPGERFCQLVFHKLHSISDFEKSRYSNKPSTEGFVKELNDEEVTLIRRGDFDTLKQKYSLDF